MNTATINEPIKSRDSALDLPLWAPFAIIALVWTPALLRFSTEWGMNPQYYYGWSVPFLAAYLIYDRWLAQPPREAPRNWKLPLLIIVLAALPQLPLRFFGEANSTARTITLGMGLVALTISLCILYLAGGRRWTGFFAPPIIFLLVSMPWPGVIEDALVKGLMRVNAEIAANVVGFAGIPAIARGNVIEVPTGVLGVNEACSGIRSLQSTLMVAIFLGLLYRRSFLGCTMLVIVGAVIAFVCNVIRTTFLTYQGAINGIDAVDKWHDAAGFAILGVVLACLWLMSHLLDVSSRKEQMPKEEAATA